MKETSYFTDLLARLKRARESPGRKFGIAELNQQTNMRRRVLDLARSGKLDRAHLDLVLSNSSHLGLSPAEHHELADLKTKSVEARVHRDWSETIACTRCGGDGGAGGRCGHCGGNGIEPSAA